MVKLEALLTGKLALQGAHTKADTARLVKKAAKKIQDTVQQAVDYLTYLRAKRRLLLPRAILEIHDPKFRKMFKRMDTNRDGAVSYTEMLAYYDYGPQTPNTDFRRSLSIQAFRRVDAYDTGKLRGVGAIMDYYVELNRLIASSFGTYFSKLAKTALEKAKHNGRGHHIDSVHSSDDHSDEDDDDSDSDSDDNIFDDSDESVSSS